MDGPGPADNSGLHGLQLVIVALPSVYDRVNQISSEKQAHLTLLYLGEPGFDSSQLTQITDYVEHAASQFHPFGLSVEERGELGDKKADVLFLNNRPDVTKFRSQLLQNDLIATAYESAEQFPEWTPHLTLGFPETPAHKMGDTYGPDGRIYHVEFDRIALWTGDSTGPTFKLNSEYFDYPEVAMSQIERGRTYADNILAHHGVKGMKWGVHKSESSGGSGSGSRGPRLSADARNASNLHTKIATKGTGSLSNQELRTYLERMDLERRYSSMQVQKKSEIDEGLNQAKRILKVAKTVEEIRKFSETPSGKAVKKGLKAAFAAAKVGVAGYTGGASAAATAAGNIAIRRLAIES